MSRTVPPPPTHPQPHHPAPRARALPASAALRERLMRRAAQVAATALLAMALLALASLPHYAKAQTASPAAGGASAAGAVLKGAEVTPDNLVDALAPAEAAPLTRGLRIERDRPGGGGAAATAKRAVSLLITFLTNSAQLTGASRQQLDTLAVALKDDRLAGRRFAVEGHADPRGSERRNLELSQARAESVRQYLMGQGVGGERLQAVGKGSTELMNTEDVTAPENRRVTIVTRPE